MIDKSVMETRSQAKKSAAMSSIFESVSDDIQDITPEKPQKSLHFSSEVIEDEEHTPSPILTRIPSIDAERRARVIAAFKRAVPKLAEERRLQIRKMAEYAKLCILDAFQGRLNNGLATNSKQSWWIYNIFCIQTSDWMYNTVVCASVLHTFSVFFEPENACPNSILFKVFQHAVMVIYACDIAMKMSYEGWKVSLSLAISTFADVISLPLPY